MQHPVPEVCVWVQCTEPVSASFPLRCWIPRHIVAEAAKRRISTRRGSALADCPADQSSRRTPAAVTLYWQAVDIQPVWSQLPRCLLSMTCCPSFAPFQACAKWRKMPPGYRADDPRFSGDWYCDMNPNREMAAYGCDAPQEVDEVIIRCCVFPGISLRTGLTWPETAPTIDLQHVTNNVYTCGTVRYDLAEEHRDAAPVLVPGLNPGNCRRRRRGSSGRQKEMEAMLL